MFGHIFQSVFKDFGAMIKNVKTQYVTFTETKNIIRSHSYGIIKTFLNSFQSYGCQNLNLTLL